MIHYDANGKRTVVLDVDRRAAKRIKRLARRNRVTRWEHGAGRPKTFPDGNVSVALTAADHKADGHE